jgi:hypothetical protein
MESRMREICYKRKKEILTGLVTTWSRNCRNVTEGKIKGRIEVTGG